MAEQNDGDQQETPREAEAMVGLACLAIAVVLLVLVPYATKTQPEGKAWFLSPRNMPLIGIAMIGLPGLAFALRLLRGWRSAADPGAYLGRAFGAFRDLGPAFGYTALFCIYLLAIPVIGFALSTLIFGQVCLWFSGLRSRRWAIWNLVFTAIIVIVLRGIMGLWFPHPALFTLMPSGIGNLLGTYL